MPRALALETSGRQGSVALAEDGVVVAEETFSHGLQHAANLLPMIDRLTVARGWTPASIDHVYVSVGPGSFTGLRVGVTLAKTLAFATGAKIVAVPSTRVLLANAPAEATEVVIVLDAKRGQIFTARFARPNVDSNVDAAAGAGAPDADWTEIEPAHLDTLAAVLARSRRPVHLIGEGLPYHRDAIPPGEPNVIVTPDTAWQAHARHVATLGTRAAANGDFADPFTLTPLYVRLPEPEEKRLAAEAAARG
ncbi:MAG TPA: tRNA (adenosine(37)-N6)-threonylcarbamoyltransferase complex dimerization subunit type 1 TsaB [Tepidisphaeraceae bacterium]